MAEEKDGTPGTPALDLTGNPEHDFATGAIASQDLDWGDVDGTTEDEDEEETPASAAGDPPAATPPGETPPATPETPPATPPDAGKEKPDVDDDALLDRMTGSKIKSKADLEALLGKPDLAKYPEAEKLVQHLEKGGTIESFNTIRAIGEIATLEDTVAVRKELEISNPAMTPAQIDLVMEKRYSQDESRNSEADIEAGKALLQLDGNAARKRLESIVEDIRVPQSVKEEAQRQEVYQKAVKDWNESVEAEVPKIDKLQFAFPEDAKPFIFDIPKEDLQDLTQLAKEILKVPDIGNALGKDEKGEFSLRKLVESLYLSQPKNMQKVISAIATNSKSRGIDEVKATVRNTQVPGAGVPNIEDGARTKWETPEEAYANFQKGG